MERQNKSLHEANQELEAKCLKSVKLENNARELVKQKDRRITQLSIQVKRSAKVLEDAGLFGEQGSGDEPRRKTAPYTVLSQDAPRRLGLKEELDKRKDEMTQLKEQLTKAGNEIAEKEKVIKLLEAELQLKAESLFESMSDLSILEETNRRLNSKISKLKEKVESFEEVESSKEEKDMLSPSKTTQTGEGSSSNDKECQVEVKNNDLLEKKQKTIEELEQMVKHHESIWTRYKKMHQDASEQVTILKKENEDLKESRAEALRDLQNIQLKLKEAQKEDIKSTEALKQEKKQLKKSIEEANLKINKLQKELEGATNAIAKNHSIEQNNEELQQQIISLKEEYTKLKNDSKTTVKELEQKLESISQQVSQLEAENAELKKEVEKATQSLDSILTSDSLHPTSESMMVISEKMEYEEESLRIVHRDWQSQLNGKDQEIIKLKNELHLTTKASKSSETELKDEIEALKIDLSKAQDDLDSEASKKAEYKGKCLKYREKNHELKKELKDTKNQLKVAQKHLTDANNRLSLFDELALEL